MKRSLFTGLGFLLVSSLLVFGAASALKKVALIDQAKCVKCGICFKNCPVKAISKIQKDGKVVQYLIDPKKCVACGACIKNCPQKAIAWAKYDAKTGKMVKADTAGADKAAASVPVKDSAVGKKSPPAGK